MAVKRKNEKKNRINDMYENAKLIKCCYCKANDDCAHKTNKEHSEKLGIKTYCTLTPNVVNNKNKKR